MESLANETQYTRHVSLEDLKMDSNMMWLICSLVSALFWIVYITYYNSRVFGYIVTRMVNKFIGKGTYFKIGSITVSPLAGKIMFRDIVYVKCDYTVRIQDGYLIFRWWRSYVPKDASEDLSHSDTRLSIMLNGFELHVYNRTHMYAKLEKIFGLEPSILLPYDLGFIPETVNLSEKALNLENLQQNELSTSGRTDGSGRKPRPEATMARTWRDLIPVIKVDISSGRVVFGNRLVPTTLSIGLEEAHLVYSTKPAASPLDHLMHFVKCQADNCKVMLANSPNYTGMIDEPPRYMGEGFVIMSSNYMELYFYMDEPGIVPEQPGFSQLANGDVVEPSLPMWGVDIKCGKGTDFSYGPWADRQRDHLFKFFFPNDWEPMQATKLPKPGEKRQMQNFDIRLSTLNEATIDILFSKNKETNAVHVNIGAGSYLDITLPWMVESTGYTTKINGQLLHLEASTSLQYRSLAESETLEFSVKCHYPLKWNQHQEWILHLTGCKATVHLIYSHKDFFQDLVNDWASKQRPDLLSFVPYTWKFSLLLKEFEIITMSNEYNWIDCSSTHQENCHLAFCGDLFDFSFDLPFTDFLPQTIPLRFWIQGEGLDLSLYVPEISTSRPILLALDSNAKILSRNGAINNSSLNAKKWRKICQKMFGWIDCWSVPIIALSINYIYHPCPPLGPVPQADITTPEKEEILLSPMRMPRCRKSPAIQWRTQPGSSNFDPQVLPPDKVSVELEIGPSVLLAYGSVLRNFIHLKENIFGDNQSFTDMHQTTVTQSDKTSQGNNQDKMTPNPANDTVEFQDSQKNQFDPRVYRPMDVTVTVTIHDIQAHLVKNCNPEDPPCPVVLIERFGFEMHKTFRETRLQLLLSPSILICADNNVRMNKDKHIQQGHLMLSALQVRGHAMFSNEGRSLDDETLEYAWLVEVQLGKLSGKLTTPQLCHIVTGLETFVLLTMDAENCLKPPSNIRLCHHGTPSQLCAHSNSEIRYRCPSGEDIKYRMTRVAIDALDIYLVENGTALHIWISPVRFSTCNLHGQQVKSGITGMLPLILMRQFISAAGHFTNSHSNTNTASSGRSSYTFKENRYSNELSEHWLEVGFVSMGPIMIEAATSLPSPEHSLHLVQHGFLKTHDENTKRLWFLWMGEDNTVLKEQSKNPRCGCLGGCAFFGSNRNGARFFKPKTQDKEEGINVAVYCINNPNQDIGFGQSLLHEGQLIFRTAPYNINNIILEEPFTMAKENQKIQRCKEARSPAVPRGQTNANVGSNKLASTAPAQNTKQSFSPVGSVEERKVIGRRFSYTSARSSAGRAREVPYGRLKENELSSRYESKAPSAGLLIPHGNNAPKSSASDSRLAVDYFAGDVDEVSMRSHACEGDVNHMFESDLSLTVKSDSEERLKQNVQRTVSMTSDNHSEAFFSADEDLTTSRTSSLRHSAINSGHFVQNGSKRKKFASDLSITNRERGLDPKGGICGDNHFGGKGHSIITHRSDHELNSLPLHQTLDRKHLDADIHNPEIVDSSESQSASSSSFISALSSQEDITLVNLHMQGNKPIIDSPLLMASYVTHLAQVRCSNWTQCSLPFGADAFSVPVFKKNSEGYMVYVGSRYIPHFDNIAEGLSTLRMVDRSDSPPTTCKTPIGPQSHPYTWDSSIMLATTNESDGEIGGGLGPDGEFLSSQIESGTRSTCVVRLKGGADIMITPLVLEGLQRLIDSLTPTLANLHLLTVVNHLHASCVSKVQDANVLKKDQSLSYWSQVHSNSKRSTAEREVPGGKGAAGECVQTNVYEECISTQIQGIIIFPKINITLLQTSLVEEIISFAALDNIQDLTCASLLATCFENVTLRCHIGKQAKEVVQTFSRPAAPSRGLKKATGIMRGPRAFMSAHLSSRARQDALPSEPVYIETSEMQQEELLVTLSVGKIHTQLRRLRNESSILKDAVITSIPAHCSRVLFTCARIPSPAYNTVFYQHGNGDSLQTKTTMASDESNLGQTTPDDLLGFIMFECGLEGVSIKIVKRSQREKNENDPNDDIGKESDVFYNDSIHSHSDNVKHGTDNSCGSIPVPEPAAHPQKQRSSSMPTPTSHRKDTINGDIFEAPPNTEQVATTKEDNGKTSSCVIELKTVWFNFAAPPRAPITRKLDFTRLDWNLLSTASPAISAWMNPSNRFFIKVMTMCRSMYRRRTAVVVCLMADALDVPSIHVPVKSRYGKLTPLAKTLQEDPSCQLCSVLQKYVLLGEVKTVENNLREPDLPLLSTLREGVIVLSRQWKNVLYTPLLLEHKYKTKLVRPINVTFAVPETDEENLFTDGECEPEMDGTEMTDECTMLLNNTKARHNGEPLQSLNGIQTNASSAVPRPSQNPSSIGVTDSVLTSPSLKSGIQKKLGHSLQPTQVPVSSRASIVFPLLNSNPFGDTKPHDFISGYGTLHEELQGSVPSAFSSVDSVNQTCLSPIMSNDKTNPSTSGKVGEDLYSWMVKQDIRVENEKTKTDLVDKTNQMAEPLLDNQNAGGINMFPIHDSLKLLDAHMIFEPLLTCLGVMPQQMPSNIAEGSDNMSSLDVLGTKLSLVGVVDMMRIDIVVSESKSDKKKAKLNVTKAKGHKFFLKIPSETPAFLCEKMGVQLELNKMADVSVDEAVRRQSVLYLSRGQLRKHTSTILNFSLNIKYISQQVNMPLLRLLHQISNMYQNVKDTQNELREQHADMKLPNSNVIPGDAGIQPREVSSLASANNDHLSSHTLIGSLDKSIILDAPTSSYNSQVSGIAVPHSISTQKVSAGLGTQQQPPISQSPSFRIRPQSLAQKLRSTGKTVKGKLGYMNLTEGTTSPTELRNNSLSNSAVERLTVISDKSQTKTAVPSPVSAPNCWRTVYYLLDLYATQPDTKTIPHRFSVAPDISEHYKNIRKFNLIAEGKSHDDIVPGERTTSTPLQAHKDAGLLSNERTRLVVFGVARIHRTRLLATLSGLKLEAEITSLQSSLTCRKKSRPASLECSLTGQVGQTMIVLLEGVAPNQQTVVKVTAGKSQTLYSSISKKNKDKNSGLLTVGAINIDIPQHPVALHGMMTRGSKQLSSTLQELRVARSSGRVSRSGGTGHMEDAESAHIVNNIPQQTNQSPQQGINTTSTKKSHSETRSRGIARSHSGLLQPLVMQFLINLESLSITAALLPSLQAQYKMDKVQSTGVTGSKAKFTIDLPQHSLSFNTKIQASEANLPSEASIALPKVHVGAEYVPDGGHQEAPIKETIREEARNMEGLVLCQGSYLSATADIGVFEHSLTTDMLNHLVFVQKVFMKEVNEVVQKVYGGEKPVPLWLEDHDEANTSVKQILFSLIIRIKRVQLTATTPTNSAVRLETGAVEFQLSNRVRNISWTSVSGVRGVSALKLFGKAQVDVNLSLGQLHRNVMFEEAEPEFQQFAFFNTRIGLRNAFQDEMAGEDKEVVLITLKRPLIYIQPMAVDKAILVWLNYKNAYEYWNEKRANLNKEVLTATQQVLEKVPFGQLSAPHLGTLFLQLTVDDMGICLPLNPLPLSSWAGRGIYDYDSRGAVVVTLESTSISACSSGSLVSKGRFVGLCLRFTDDFETSLDDWKPDMNDSSIMNLCVVSEGTYEVCSRTIAAKQGVDNAKWFLNVQWQMEGVDIHLDVNVGKQLSALGHTLTMLTGSEEDEQLNIDSDSDDGQKASQENILSKSSRKWMDSLPAFVFDPNIDAKKRSKLIEKEMNEQAKIINDLRTLGASQGTIEHEMRRLHELEALIFKDFRRDMIQKLRRQSMRTSTIKDKLGIGQNSSTRTKSFVAPSPTPEHHIELESPMLETIASGDSGGESSPGGGPSRSASLKVRGARGTGGQPRVTFGDAPHVHRQSSLPGANSVASLPEPDPDWVLDSTEDIMIIDGSAVQMRRKSPQSTTSSAETKSSDISKIQKPQEPNIDFELDVKVLINSGKCVLHTKDLAKEEEIKMRMRKERSSSAAGLDAPPPGSPSTSRRHREKVSTSANSRLRYNHAHLAQLVDLTIFHIPGLDVKVHYESKTLSEECTSPRASSMDTGGYPGRKPGTKRASLFAWTTLQSIPEETVISPHILEFLEQTLEPIPTKTNLATASGQLNTRVTIDDVSNYGQYVYASFPVDVIVYFHMQPSTFRFSCLPVSRVECMLQLPSLDIVFSSKRQEEELCSEFGYGTNAAAIGGLSVTGCLADFSVYIFHPYGGKKSGLKEAQCSPLSDSERKDSLSINVEFVKFHLSRSRKLNFQTDNLLKSQTDKSRAVIRFSTIIDIGSASFKYDMRRLTEILAFPKAWYRRSIVRHLFLGDLSMQSPYLDDSFTEDVSKNFDKFGENLLSKTGDKSPLIQKEKLTLSFDNDLSKHSNLKDNSKMYSFESNSTLESPELSDIATHSAWETLVLFAVNFTKLSVQMNMGNVMGNVMWLTKDFRSHGRLSIGSTGHKNMYLGFGLGGSSLDAKGGIVGGTIELSQINTHVHIREEAGSEPDHILGVCLLALELRLDYMGTSAVMARVSRLDAELRDEWRSERASNNVTRRPATIFIHGDLRWDQLQIMISKSTTVDLLKMFHKLEEFFSQQFKSSKRVFSSLQPRVYPRPATGSGTGQSGPGLTRHKAASKKKPPAPGECKDAWGPELQDARHHRHWQKALRLVTNLAKSTLKIPLPLTGTVLGGTMQLRGSNISLACFHGINFKCRSWALFSLHEPCIDFSTESQEIHSTDGSEGQRVHIVQTLTFGLGLSENDPNQRQAPPLAQHRSMATVCRMSRNVIFPPQYKTPREWFHYAFAGSDIDAVDRFPCVERERTEPNTNSIERSRSGGAVALPTAPKLTDPNHTREVIFALPSLQLHLKTEHLQTSSTPDTIVDKPMVECSFITEFEDHIFVTVDAEAFFFLHDLITSYVKEKERVTGQSGPRSSSPDPRGAGPSTSTSSSAQSNVLSPANMSGEERKRRGFDPTDMFTKDWRDFNCKTWHLEPTVRLLSWAGKSIEPYGVDYILQKLGFSHARTTIPKWMQRGFMDPLDKLLSVLMAQLITIVREDPQLKT